MFQVLKVFCGLINNVAFVLQPRTDMKLALRNCKPLSHMHLSEEWFVKHFSLMPCPIQS